MAQAKCDHTKVVLRRKYTDSSYTDSWHCDDCEVEFLSKPQIDELCKRFLFPEPKIMRDEFAMAALAGLLADPNVIVNGTAALCYKVADEMLEARKK